MPIYKAIAKDKSTGKTTIITSEYKSKQAFIHDIRANGYMVDPNKVKTKKEFDRIMNKTNAEKWDWNKRIGK